MSNCPFQNEHEFQVYFSGGVFTTQIPRGYSVVPVLEFDKEYYKELSRKYNIAFLNKNKTEMSKLEKEMKHYRALVR